MKRIHTYYNHVNGISPHDSFKLINLWRERWAAAGFTPVVLSEWHSRKHPLYDELKAFATNLPSVNSVEYETACWLRWVAVATQDDSDGVLMADYDVFPVAFNAETFGDMTTMKVSSVVRILQGACSCPSLVYSNRHAIEELVRLFLTCNYGRRAIQERDHFSDMYAIEDLAVAGNPLIENVDVVKGYGDAGWEKALAVHFSNSSMTPRGMTPRWACIPQLIDEALKIKP